MPTNAALRRLRFSLQTLALIVTIVAMAIVIGLLYSELVPLRDENRRLRDEVGELTIEDESKFHAILTPHIDPDEFRWRWRIWIPEGRSYRLQFASHKIPKQGVPTPQGTLTLNEPGEQWVEYRMFRETDSGKWRDILSVKNASVSGDYQQWPEWTHRVGAGNGVGDMTEVFEPDKRVELIRRRMSQAANSASIEDPAAGYMIWLDPAP